MKIILFTALSFMFQLTVSGQNKVICAEVFQGLIATELDVIDQGDFDRSYYRRIESEDFRKYIYKKVVDRDRNQGTNGGSFGIGPFKFRIPSLSNKSDKEITEDVINQLRSIRKTDIDQADESSWLKRFATKFLPAQTRSEVLNSWNECNSGIISLERHKENVRVILAKIKSSTKIQEANIERLTALDHYTHMENLQRLKNENKISERTYKLELARIEAKKTGLFYYIDEKDSKVIDIVLEWRNEVGQGKLVFKEPYIEGATLVNTKSLNGQSFERRKRLRFKRKESAKKVSILLETNYEAIVEYYKDYSNLVELKTMDFKSGTYAGEVRNGLPHGQGVYSWILSVGGKEEWTYEGTFQNGEFVYGEHRLDGALYLQGEFKNFKLHGEGRRYSYFLPSGRLDSEGTWADGKLIEGVYISGTSRIPVKNGVLVQD